MRNLVILLMMYYAIKQNIFMYNKYMEHLSTLLKIVLIFLPQSIDCAVKHLVFNNNENSIQACKGIDTIEITWDGHHNIMETESAECSSPEIGLKHDYQNLGTIITFPDTGNEDLGAEPGETRYFKCKLHCGAGSRFEVFCPPASSETIVCIEKNSRVLDTNGFYIKMIDIKEGDMLQTANGGNTTVKKKILQKSNDYPWYIPNNICNSVGHTILSPSHAIKCNGKWTSAKEIGKREAVARTIEYINLQTNNYCDDELLLESGIIIETWDGRLHNEWRPHSYVNGERINCH